MDFISLGFLWKDDEPSDLLMSVRYARAIFFIIIFFYYGWKGFAVPLDSLVRHLLLAAGFYYFFTLTPNDILLYYILQCLYGMQIIKIFFWVVHPIHKEFMEGGAFT